MKQSDILVRPYVTEKALNLMGGTAAQGYKDGNKIEFIFNTDRSDPDVTYWLFKTIYDGTTDTLEGNDRELNEWGCASIGENATTYRILLTANDVKNLKEHGMFVNGYNINVSQVNLLRRVEPTDMNI